jgi:Dehydrogenases with different specificities (related to short-chain alcohol dehydrogenases)
MRIALKRIKPRKPLRSIRRKPKQATAMHNEAPPAVSALKGRRVLVTGGARGLGAAFVRSLVQAGAQVVFGDVLHDEGRRSRRRWSSKATQ